MLAPSTQTELDGALRRLYKDLESDLGDAEWQRRLSHVLTYVTGEWPTPEEAAIIAEGTNPELAKAVGFRYRLLAPDWSQHHPCYGIPWGPFGSLQNLDNKALYDLVALLALLVVSKATCTRSRREKLASAVVGYLQTRGIDPSPPAGSATGRRRGRPRRGEAPVHQLLRAALLKHHKFEPGGSARASVGNWEPARQIDLIRALASSHRPPSTATVSRFFKRHFRGHAAYRRMCCDGSLPARLERLSGEGTEQRNVLRLT
jgi:hypothetical protein